MKRPLKPVIKQHLQSKFLDHGQLAALTALQQAHSRRRNKPWWQALAGAAAILLLVLALQIPAPTPQTDKLIASIAAEVVENHLHLKPLEIKTNELDTVRSYFTELNFSPVSSEYLNSIGLQLMGGRYCSLQGITAAQLRFKTLGSDHLHTLYQVGYDPKLFSELPHFDQGQTPVSTYSSGIKVTLWVEKDILFALTEN